MSMMVMMWRSVFCNIACRIERLLYTQMNCRELAVKVGPAMPPPGYARCGVELVVIVMRVLWFWSSACGHTIVLHVLRD